MAEKIPWVLLLIRVAFNNLRYVFNHHVATVIPMSNTKKSITTGFVTVLV